VATLSAWAAACPEAVALRKHALRTLLEQGNPEALELLGFRKGARATVAGMAVNPETVRIGEHAYLEFEVISTGDEPVMVDYAVVFQYASGTGSRKVFKGLVAELAAGGSLALRHKISLQPMSARQIFAGTHIVEAQVNGVVHASVGFGVVE
jgi:hypothetical protein